jgi:anti-sigma regulatory factor (Ser/Thr protein kinase)
MLLFFLRHRVAIAEQAQRVIDAAVKTRAQPSRLNAARKRQRAIDRAVQEAARYAAQHAFGICAKAQLANKVEWGLREQGMPAEAIEEVVGTLVLSFKQAV